MILSCKYKLNPTKSQIETFEEWSATCRFLYNVALEERITAYKTLGKSISKFEQYNELPGLKIDFPFIKKVYSDVLQQVLDRLDLAYKSFFRGGGFPKFKSKKFYNSFTFKRFIRIEGNKVKLPKIGWVKFFNSKEISNLKTATILKEADGWFISITYEVNSPDIAADYTNPIGIDAGIVHHSYLSDGTYFDGNYAMENNLKQLRILNRKLSRAKKGSNKRAKLVLKLQKLHNKISNQRKDFNHKLSKKVTDEYSMIFVEDLKISNMTKLNSTLSRRMLDNAFYSFRMCLEYKCKLKGKHFDIVPPHYTSQTCTECSHVDKESRVTQSEFICTNCGNIENADLVGAKNILRKGIAKLAKRKSLD